MHTITTVHAREILDSRGIPTISATCVLSDGTSAEASVPSGASTGTHEAHELRDTKQTRYGGNGVRTAVAHINTDIAQAVSGNTYTQETLDNTLRSLDGTEQKTRLGANAILAVSLAFARACAHAQHIPLYKHLANGAPVEIPQIACNVLNGGVHADSGLSVQEFLLIPTGYTTISERLEAVGGVITVLKTILHAKGYSIGVGDEGGFAPALPSTEAALDVLVQAIEQAGCAGRMDIGLDIAASELYDGNTYALKSDGVVRRYTTPELIVGYQNLIQQYPIISLEDPFAEDDWEGFAALVSALHHKVMIVGDDLVVTQTARIQRAIDTGAVTAVLIKPNQVGTVSETLAAITLAQSAGLLPFMSHRSGETMDTFISDLAVACRCPYIKAGSLARGERIEKYNRLLAIADAGAAA